MYHLFLFRRGHENATGPGLRRSRRAMLAALLLFGPFSYFMATNNSLGEKEIGDLWPLRWVGYGACLLAVIVVAALRRRWSRTPESMRPNLGQIGSGIAMLAAMFGGLVMLSGGEVWIYAIGMLVFLGAWSLLPVDPQAV